LPIPTNKLRTSSCVLMRELLCHARLDLNDKVQGIIWDLSGIAGLASGIVSPFLPKTKGVQATGGMLLT